MARSKIGLWFGDGGGNTSPEMQLTEMLATGDAGHGDAGRRRCRSRRKHFSVPNREGEL
ncbi:hypothetical protein HanIR_Chr16g0795721 [Helianthus annuus]|nr:hypothetical protein HanIR_Chr16g0795721 [Helianthus annuus]